MIDLELNQRADPRYNPPASPMHLCTMRRELHRRPHMERRPHTGQPNRYRLDQLTSLERQWLEQDLERAAEFQRQLLPDENLRCEGWEISYSYKAFGPLGGDYCDIVKSGPEGKDMFVALGDACGRGVAASLLMAQLFAILRTLGSANLPILEVMERANDILCQPCFRPSFVTLVCVRATSEGEVEICNAGHCSPILVGRCGGTQIDSGGLPLGLFTAARWSLTRMRVAKGETLVLYTDGLTEARDSCDDEYGADRLLRKVREGSALPPQSLVETCIQSVAAFQKGAPPSDDATVMAMRCV